VLDELVTEAEAGGSPEAELAKELEEALGDLETRVARLELQSLLSGEYDESDAIVELHSGAGGTDAQDWCEMLLRMYQRWAERRGFDVEIDEATAGQEAGTAVGHLHREGSLRLRPPVGRTWRPSSGPDVAVRLATSSADELRLARRHARSSRTCPTRWPSTTRT
jgi:hypothetical protein